MRARRSANSIVMSIAGPIEALQHLAML